MFKINKNKHFFVSWAILILLQNSFGTIDCSVVPPVKELCPCLPRSICPRTYGTSAYDEYYLGTFLKCAEPDEARCCGVSVEVVVIGKSSDANVRAVEDVSMAPELTTVENDRLTESDTTTEMDITTQSNDEIQSTTYDNEIVTTLSPDSMEVNEDQTTVPTIQEEHAEARNAGDDILRIFPSSELNHINPSYVKIINNSPAMLVFAVNDNNLSIGKTEELDDIPVTQATIDPETDEEIFKQKQSVEKTAENMAETNDIAELVETTEKLVEPKAANEITVKPDEIVPEHTLTHVYFVQESADSEVTTTPTLTETDGTIPDLISTMEVDNQIEVRHNKRRSSNYRGSGTVPTNQLPITLNSYENPPQIFPNELAIEFSKQKLYNTSKKLDIVNKLNGISETALDVEHKNEIVKVQSLLATISKQMNGKGPRINRSNSLQQLIANDKKLFKPTLGRRKMSAIGRKTTPEPTTTTTTTTTAATAEEIETTTQSKRKYTRRLPVRGFGESSKIKSKTKATATATTTTTTTTTASPNENENESTTPRNPNRFNRRRLYTKKIETQSTTSAIELTTKSSEPLQNSLLPSRATLEKRKMLFASRRNGGWSKMGKPTESAAEITTENAKDADQAKEVSSTTELVSEKSNQIVQENKFRVSQRRYNYRQKPNRYTTTESTTNEGD